MASSFLSLLTCHESLAASVSRQQVPADGLALQGQGLVRTCGSMCGSTTAADQSSTMAVSKLTNPGVWRKTSEALKTPFLLIPTLWNHDCVVNLSLPNTRGGGSMKVPRPPSLGLLLCRKPSSPFAGCGILYTVVNIKRTQPPLSVYAGFSASVLVPLSCKFPLKQFYGPGSCLLIEVFLFARH